MGEVKRDSPRSASSAALLRFHRHQRGVAARGGGVDRHHALGGETGEVVGAAGLSAVSE